MNEQKDKIFKTPQLHHPEFKIGVVNQMKQQLMAVQLIFERIAFNIQKKISQGNKMKK